MDMGRNAKDEYVPEDSFSRKGDDSDSLRLYYRQLSSSEPLTAEEELSLWREMDCVRGNIRSLLYRFGFVMPEHVKLFQSVAPDSLVDFFSIDEESGTFLLLDGWIKEISAHYEKQKAAFSSGNLKKLELLREKGVALLSRYPAAPDKLFEWYRVASVYQVRLNKQEGRRELIEEKLLLHQEDFNVDMNRLSEYFHKLEDIRQRILKANLRLVVSIVRPFRNSRVPTGDLIQEGNLGLIKALERFDYRLGHKFSTYATWWIKQAVSKAIAVQSRIIRLPAHMLVAISRIKRAERNFIQKNGREPSVDELSIVLEMPRERVNAIRKMAAQSISLQAPITDDLDSPTLEQFLDSESEDNPAKKLAYKFLRERLNEAIECLTEREQQIITLHFGLSGKEQKSLLELSELFGLTRERIRQLEARALHKLRDPKISSNLQDYFL